MPNKFDSLESVLRAKDIEKENSKSGPINEVIGMVRTLVRENEP